MTNRTIDTEARTSPERITAAAVASFDNCPDPRLRQLMQALVRHLHAYAREVKLTQAEWEAAIGILTATGHITTDKRQEFILWSDTLGLSMLVDALEHAGDTGGTESTVLGPFYVPGAPLREFDASISERPVRTPVRVFGRVLSTDGGPIAGAELDVWQNGENSLYTVQDPDAPEDHLRGRFRTRADGSYAFVGVRPLPYPVPEDGPVGAMIAATGRHPYRPAHIHMIVSAPGYQPLTTHIFDSTSVYLDSDVVFAVKPSLVREFVRHSPDEPDRPEGVKGEWYSVQNDIVLAPAK
jgi:hydroxyquinol 1,2-dioxygenase